MIYTDTSTDQSRPRVLVCLCLDSLRVPAFLLEDLAVVLNILLSGFLCCFLRYSSLKLPPCSCQCQCLYFCTRGGHHYSSAAAKLQRKQLILSFFLYPHTLVMNVVVVWAIHSIFDPLDPNWYRTHGSEGCSTTKGYGESGVGSILMP